MRSTFAIVLFLIAHLLAAQPVKVGSKKFTESVILGEIARLAAEQAGYEAQHRRELGGTRVLFNALTGAEIDIYPEYTGTILREILAGRKLGDFSEAIEVLDSLGIGVIMPLGFNNTYALGMNKQLARELGIEKISDLQSHPKLNFGFSNEFMDRSDGWPALQKAYELPQENVRGLDHDLAYRGLESGAIQLTELYSTDAEIRYYNLKVLQDDKNHFPEYQALYLYRRALESENPAFIELLRRLRNSISEGEMVKMNALAKLERISAARVAASFLEEKWQTTLQVKENTIWKRLRQHTLEHLLLVGISLGFAILISIPMGIWAVKKPRLGQFILGATGIVQTIPSLAVLVFMIPLLGIGAKPAMVALFLYSLLPIVRNTHSGIKDISSGIRESAEALGLTAGERLRFVELPLATRSILAGIKTAAVINVGTATLGALIGAGGYGQPILTGIRLDDIGLILEGAVPAALLALVVQGLFDLLEKWLVAEGT